MPDPLQQPDEPKGSLWSSTRRQAGDIAARFSSQRHRQILDTLAPHDQLTMFEVAERLKCFVHQISGRFGELEAAGLIEKTGYRRKNESGRECEVYRIKPEWKRDPLRPEASGPPDPSAPQLQARGFYTETLILSGDDGGTFDISPILGEDDLPGVPYSRRMGPDKRNGGETWRLEPVSCPGCGAPLRMTIESHAGKQTKKFRCGTAKCNRTWELATAKSPGGQDILVTVMKTL